MASKPITACCVSGFKHEGTPVGALEAAFVQDRWGDVEAYIIRPAQSNDTGVGILL